jgi:hypothetical protein
VPFGKFFDIRFVIAALPPFLLLTAVGLVALGKPSPPPCRDGGWRWRRRRH